VPFGCYRREIFDQIGLFDEELIRNQDDEFNGRLIKNGGHIYLIPEIVIDYYARGKIGKLSQMFYQYGLFKPW
jgi:GT2 family glycosyltransferase